MVKISISFRQKHNNHSRHVKSRIRFIISIFLLLYKQNGTNSLIPVNRFTSIFDDMHSVPTACGQLEDNTWRNLDETLAIVVYNLFSLFSRFVEQKVDRKNNENNGYWRCLFETWRRNGTFIKTWSKFSPDGLLKSCFFFALVSLDFGCCWCWFIVMGLMEKW